jgi:methionine-rich copper-binding protein CopC
MSTSGRKALFFISSLLLLILAPQQSAFAHTDLVSSTPAADSVLDSLPNSISLEFNEDLLVLSDKETSSIEVTASGGEQVDDAQSVVTGRNLSVGLIQSELAGTFNVTWRAVAQDGHPVEGTFTFSVTEKVDATPSPEVSIAKQIEVNTSDSPSIIEIVIIGALALIGLVILIFRWRRNPGD